jgi:serine/threonine protein phosphatase PrpC
MKEELITRKTNGSLMFYCLFFNKYDHHSITQSHVLGTHKVQRKLHTKMNLVPHSFLILSQWITKKFHVLMESLGLKELTNMQGEKVKKIAKIGNVTKEVIKLIAYNYLRPY